MCMGRGASRHPASTSAPQKVSFGSLQLVLTFYSLTCGVQPDLPVFVAEGFLQVGFLAMLPTISFRNGVRFV